MELQLYFRMLRQGWWIVALTTLTALNIALVASYLATPQYRASARFLVSPDTALASESRDLINSLQTLDRRSIITTYAEVLGSRRVYNEAIRSLNLDPQSLADYRVSTVALPDANVIQLSIEGPNPQMAMVLANSLGQQGVNYIKELYQIYDIAFLDQATMPTAPFKPQPLRDAGLAIVLGLVIGSALAVLREQLRTPLEALWQRTIIDSASSAYNRRYFQRRLEQELANRETDLLSFGLIQLDGLQDLKETLPPGVAQRLLQNVTKTLRSELRGNDSVGRWDDTRFAVLLPATPSTAAVRTLERIRQTLARPIELNQDGLMIKLDPHVGVASCQGTHASKEVIERAEAALEKARRNGTATVALDDL
jgi:diguanylate cyclase (GGDEF)-like protein